MEPTEIWICFICMCVVAIVLGLLIWVNVWHYKELKAQGERRAKMTPEELDKDLFEEWADNQW